MVEDNYLCRSASCETLEFPIDGELYHGGITVPESGIEVFDPTKRASISAERVLSNGCLAPCASHRGPEKATKLCPFLSLLFATFAQTRTWWVVPRILLVGHRISDLCTASATYELLTPGPNSENVLPLSPAVKLKLKNSAGGTIIQYFPLLLSREPHKGFMESRPCPSPHLDNHPSTLTFLFYTRFPLPTDSPF
ncbi:hypothetical protein NLI96_g4696 [Meripilus lineatus]|uniref:Uncharacterized protein n=1 Tax=Meripilus lineatus TaxID=2056292 RepID=A0AAD5YJV4_9APHY|nr:hypothetical protein NLI96_g4696 [Physisporinus lineatus]